jgi:hypothetical protein
MVGLVGTALGEHQINIKELDLGTGPTGDLALMVLSTDSVVSTDVVAHLRAQDGVVDAQAIELGSS